jgi:small subunit ribosomal protein S12
VPTISQLAFTRIRLVKRHKIKSVALKKNPFKRGTCVKILTRTPKKPNSAIRKIAKVRLSSGALLFAFVPGETHTLQVHSSVLISGRPARDLPGVNYRMVRGVLDLKGLDRIKKRSKYGCKRKPG